MQSALPERSAGLKKTLYGLKQSGRHWYQKLVKIMVTHLKFTQCEVDQAVFFWQNRTAFMVVLVHTDNCTIVATAQPLINSFKIAIAKHVQITNLGEIHWILGIEIWWAHENCQIYLSQHSYIESTLWRYGCYDSRIYPVMSLYSCLVLSK